MFTLQSSMKLQMSLRVIDIKEKLHGVRNTNVEGTYFFHVLKLKYRDQFCFRVFVLFTWSFQNFTSTSVSLFFAGG